MNNQMYFEIESGNIKGIASGRTPTIAARKILRATKNPEFGILARFRECSKKGGNILIFAAEKKDGRKRAVWKYQKSEYLFGGSDTPDDARRSAPPSARSPKDMKRKIGSTGKAFGTGYLAIGNEELANQPDVTQNTEMTCPKCNRLHKLQWGKEKGIETKMLGKVF